MTNLQQRLESGWSRPPDPDRGIRANRDSMITAHHGKVTHFVSRPLNAETQKEVLNYGRSSMGSTVSLDTDKAKLLKERFGTGERTKQVPVARQATQSLGSMKSSAKGLSMAHPAVAVAQAASDAAKDIQEAGMHVIHQNMREEMSNKVRDSTRKPGIHADLHAGLQYDALDKHLRDVESNYRLGTSVGGPLGGAIGAIITASTQSPREVDLKTANSPYGKVNPQAGSTPLSMNSTNE